MIVNKVVLLISPARAREEELISQSAALVFAWLHCWPPRELAAEWTSLNSAGEGGGSRGCPIRCVTPLLSQRPEAETLSRR